MRKAHKILTFAAVGLQLLSFLIFFIMILFQRNFKQLLSNPMEVIDTFIFPIASTLYMLCATVAVLLICLGLFFKGRGIWAELLCILMLVIACPLIARLGTAMETMLLVSPKGVTHLASFSALSSVTNIATGITDVSSALALVACGISMVLKKTTAD